jgi:hypothetical protein
MKGKLMKSLSKEENVWDFFTGKTGRNWEAGASCVTLYKFSDFKLMKLANTPFDSSLDALTKVFCKLFDQRTRLAGNIF